MLYQKLLRY